MRWPASIRLESQTLSARKYAKASASTTDSTILDRQYGALGVAMA
jgi:hypothetical protein